MAPKRLIPLADDLWHVESMFGAVFPIRMTVRRTDQGLVLWSPVEIDDALALALDALGPVKTIVAPNLFHYGHVASAKSRYASAEVWAPEALTKKQPSVPIDSYLTAGLDLGDGCTVHEVEGSEMISEFVLHDAASNTLAVTDLLFNVVRAHNFRSWLVFRVVAGTLGRAGMSRLWRMFVKDEGAAGASMQRLVDLPFERLLMSHGSVIETGGREALAHATARWRDGVRPA